VRRGRLRRFYAATSFFTPQHDRILKGLAWTERTAIVRSWHPATATISASGQAVRAAEERTSTRVISPSPVRSNAPSARPAATRTGSAARLVRQLAGKEEGAAGSTPAAAVPGCPS
jgi:hypothetical protein